ncbi:class II fructose-bisphosphate aldolase [Demequina lignilytica]|uniref:Fructose-bisphosphate aldolase n=1 Tax=Demequina lignilytica TaxID=3051663 RepID=A0AAW7MA73_9MICO|nr:MULTISPECIES: class II fructose-bisphosphate aldolase [unclassified Demequina]MDN4478744.1 class II fructose-bisphosphate aldolase [Demequina sp. SYSU T00039-1]MDN4483294.1 class II fructose-bisphosphate aldolase [Demequina sp. SYSU T0a273]MDN4488721.1 class II fructose-bisphosphate aldolase [Demequina sp. SYSU T00039]MDN4491673.1 class II fructose-bisphosphate aldolase [Demequina sp. SYSU T00068]
MAIATTESYAAMLDAAKAGGYAFPAINITSSSSVTAAIQGFAEAESDGIIQVSVGGGQYASGSTIKDAVVGSLALAAYARVVAEKYGVTIALHTDHCHKVYLEEWLKPLLKLEAESIAAGNGPIFNSHMWDGSSVPMDENLAIAEELLELSQAADTILEIEIGVVGGEEDGHSAEVNDKLYSTPEDGIATIEKLGLGEKGRYMTAMTFGNVHGAYKPGAVKLRPEILGDIQAAAAAKFGKEKPFDLVFHGGSGSTAEEIATAVSHGVIKMNIDTDTQYAYTRPVVDHMMKNYDGVLKVDGEWGNKKAYDPRAWGKLAEAGMAARVVEACEQLGSAGKKI